MLKSKSIVALSLRKRGRYPFYVAHSVYGDGLHNPQLCPLLRI